MKDKYSEDPTDAVDVIMPILTINKFFYSNLIAIYAEIPVNRLIIGDAGVSPSLHYTLKEFPRVKIVDQTEFKTLGYSLRRLIEMVQTEWFVYLHCDVLLPAGWFDTMKKHQGQYDWFECDHYKTILLNYPDEWQNQQERPYSGSQMGRRKAFLPFLYRLKDDYVYRNEDLVFRDILERAGGRYGKVHDTYHYHQVTDNAEANIVPIRSDEWMKKTYDMQARGIIKYTCPGDDYLEDNLVNALVMMGRLGILDKKELIKWTWEVNSWWAPFVKKALWLRTGKSGEIITEIKKMLRSGQIIFRTILGKREFFSGDPRGPRVLRK